jgi:hypothetical protein
MVERLIPNSELCALCRGDRTTIAVAWYHGLHQPANSSAMRAMLLMYGDVF